MGIPPKQTGWSRMSNLLHDIIKELDRLIKITANSNTISVNSQTSTTTVTPDSSFDAYQLTAQAAGLTIANPSTDYSDFDGFMIRIKDNGVAKALTFGSKYRPHDQPLPTTTTAGKVMIIVGIYDATDDMYDTKYSEEV